MDARNELVRLYTAYNPRRLKDVDDVLERFRGREQVMLHALREKYERDGTAKPASAALFDRRTAASSLSGSMLDIAAAAGAPVSQSMTTPPQLPRSQRTAPADPPPSPPPSTASSLFNAAAHPRQRRNTAAGLSPTADPPDEPPRDTVGFPAAMAFNSWNAASPSSPVTSSFFKPFAFHNGGRGSGSDSAARQAEMRQLVEQMTSVDVEQLVARVETELTRAAARTGSGAALAATEESRVPRLQWKRSTGTEALSASLPSRDTFAVLQHTAVFLKHFVKCASRFASLARDEQAHWAESGSESQRGREMSAAAAGGATSSSAFPAATVDGESARHQQTNEQSLRSTTPFVWPARRVSMATQTNSELPEPHDTQSRRAGAGLASSTPHRTSRSPRTPSPPSPPPRAEHHSRWSDAAEPEEGRGERRHQAERGQAPPSPHPAPLHGNAEPEGHPQATARLATATRARSSSSSCVRRVRHHAATTSPSTDTAGSPPTCRATTVSPLTSPDGTPGSPARAEGKDEHHSSLAAVQERRAAASASLSTPSPLRYDAQSGRHRRLGTNEEDSPLSDEAPHSTPLPPPPLTTPPHDRRRHLLHADAPRDLQVVVSPPAASPPEGALSLRPARVHTWTPAATSAPGQANRYGPLCRSVCPGDCVVLQPGVYYENLHFENCGRVELTSAYPGAAVVLRPASDLDPVLTVCGPGSQVVLKGLVFVQGELRDDDGDDEASSASESLAHAGVLGVKEAHSRSRRRHTAALARPAVQLLSLDSGAQVRASACHFYGASGGGVVAAGTQTRLRMHLCLVSLCRFAGVYIHGGASAELTQSKIKKSEVGLRVLQGSFVVAETTIEDNESDGLVLYEESMGVLEKSSVLNNGGNGIFLASGAEVRVAASTVELNALYGVQRSRGATLHIKSSFVRDNGLLPINETAEKEEGR